MSGLPPLETNESVVRHFKQFCELRQMMADQAMAAALDFFMSADAEVREEIVVDYYRRGNGNPGQTPPENLLVAQSKHRGITQPIPFRPVDGDEDSTSP